MTHCARKCTHSLSAGFFHSSVHSTWGEWWSKGYWAITRHCSSCRDHQLLHRRNWRLQLCVDWTTLQIHLCAKNIRLKTFHLLNINKKWLHWFVMVHARVLHSDFEDHNANKFASSLLQWMNPSGKLSSLLTWTAKQPRQDWIFCTMDIRHKWLL